MELLPILTCDNCGACCMEMSSPPMFAMYMNGVCDLDDGTIDAEMVLTMPFEARLEILIDLLHVKDREVDGYPCCWLDMKTRKCKWYEFRPEICRFELERGDESCRGWRETYGIPNP